MNRRRDELLRVILIGTAIPGVLIWLPLVRGIADGPSYEWAHSFLGLSYGGRGTGGYYWLIAVQATFVVILLYLGWRGAKQPFHWLLIVWNGSQAADAVYNAVQFPDKYRFRGDTLGVDVSLAWVGPLFYGGLALLSAIWIAREIRRGGRQQPHRWGRSNTIWLVAATSLLPIQFALLRFGEPHGTTDQVGVMLTLLQWLILNLSLARRYLFEARSAEATVA